MTPTNGRHFLQIPGPTNVPDRILNAMHRPTIDHRGPEFARLGADILDRLGAVFGTEQPVVIYPSSGTGAWEASLVNTLSPGDKVLMYETGHFASLWHTMAIRLGLQPEYIASDWRRGADPDAIEKALAADTDHELKAVCVVHNETSTGATTRIADIRKVMDRAGHPALLMVDTISSLGSIDYRMDEWGVDVTVAGSQKGLMLPPGLAFNAVSEKALHAASSATLPKSYWDWGDILAANKNRFFSYTPATNLLYGLREAIDMLLEEGLGNVFARHARHAEATRLAVHAWGLELLCTNPSELSNSLTAVCLPDGHDADRFRGIVLEKFDMSLGAGLGKMAGRIFRIGHLGSFNDLMLMGTLSGVEMGLALAGVPHRRGGAAEAQEHLRSTVDAVQPAARTGARA